MGNDISTATREWLRACATNAEKVKSLIDGGVDVQTANANGFTSLHMAAAKFNLDAAEALVDAGADVNTEECNGLTPLDYCVDSANGSKAYVAMVEFLESKGGMRRQERCWMAAMNQEKYAPNA